MQPKIHMFNAVPFVATPYHPRTYLRSDAFRRQFTLSCQGQIEYPEDDPTYGTWWTHHVLKLGHRGLIEEAIALARCCVAEHAFDLDAEALDFKPELILIHDSKNRLVLAGEPSSQGIRWCEPVTSDEEVAGLGRQINALCSEASYESGWDNDCTVPRLRLQARVVAGRLVDPCWRQHARQALRSTLETEAVH